jgi:shikimate dehydrogenase
MLNFALVGKNISHSKSPEVYKKLISLEHTYTLLDFNDEKIIPSTAELFKKYNGINITSPYKKHFLPEVQLTEIAKSLEAINCLKIENGTVIGTNTDYFAIKEILEKFIERYKKVEFIVLGDGVMSKVACSALSNLNLNYKILSRKLIKDFINLNLLDYLNQEKMIVLNTCSRDFVYSGEIHQDIIFWDFNYNFDLHKQTLGSKCDYVDGYEMLFLQAKYAVEFWSI